MKADILIIEDVKELSDLFELYIKKEGFQAFSCETAEEGLELLKKRNVDLIILDINLPGMDGFEFLQELRKNNSVPVIIVSAREADEDMILGLGIGADEFVTKPVSPKVLVARVRAVLRRSKMSNTKMNTIDFGPFSLNPEAYSLKCNNNRVAMSAREVEILSYLAQHPGQVFNPEHLFQKIWDNRFGDLTTVAVYIQRIRKKIEKDAKNPEYVKTIHGKGYSFNKDMLRQ
ncbi:MAG: response regulator transcription factor [Spirochaetales bacterium]|nr:response regulator transcription factor [Spirochaetales bacterium]